MPEDISILQKYASNCPKTLIVTPLCQVVSFELLSICSFVGKLVCLVGTASIFCSAPVKLLPFPPDFKNLVVSKFLCLNEIRQR